MFEVIYFVGTDLDKMIYTTNSKQEACSFAIRTSKWARCAMVMENSRLKFVYINGIKQ